jgi:hypothetical protein
VLVRQQPAQLVMIHELGEELPRHVGLEQPIAVLREHRRHPYRLVHAEPDEPQIEKVIIEPVLIKITPETTRDQAPTSAAP